jgi:endoglucanase Acf2
LTKTIFPESFDQMLRLKLASVVIMATVLIGIFSYPFFSPKTGSSTTPKTTLSHSQTAALNPLNIANLEQDQYKVAPKKYVTDRFGTKIAPTNKIWSDVPYNGRLSGLFLFPVAAKVDQGSLIISVPEKRVVPEASLITGQISSQYIKIAANQPISKVYLDDYSDLTVRLEFRDTSDTPVFSVQFVQGSPYIQLIPVASQPINISSSLFSLAREKDANDIPIFTSLGLNQDALHCGIITKNQTTITSDTLTITPTKQNSSPVTFGFFTDQSARGAVLKAALNPIQSINVSPTSENGDFTNSFGIQYENSAAEKNTIFGLLPHQYRDNRSLVTTQIMGIDTLRGMQKFVSVGESWNQTVPKVELKEQLTLPENILKSNRDTLVDTLRQDIVELSAAPTGSYFASKHIAKTADLLEYADILKADEEFKQLKTTLNEEISDWFTYSGKSDTKFFSYDSGSGGVIASNPEFGLEKYNDHHFHYGYFLHGAVILSKYDPAFLKNSSPVIDAMVSDIANDDRNSEHFPYIRTFDMYESHSWASGTQSFSDGNNQESSSEAINAWYNVWRWGRVSNNPALEKLGAYLYANEVNGTQNYWLNTYNDQSIFPQNYTPQFASLVWGGKIEYNTFFSKDPLAIDGIQYLPFTAGSIYLNQPSKIAQRYQVRTPDLSKVDTGWQDLSLMYAGINPQYGIINLPKLKTLSLDSGNTRTNMNYWLLYWQSQK